MELKVTNISGKASGSQALNKDVFGLDPRLDIISRVVRWQDTCSKTGSSNSFGRSDVKATTAKPFRQKGTGNARQGSKVAPHMRGGGVAHGPTTRNMETKLNKKIRKLGLRHALSLKAKENNVVIFDNFTVSKPSTKAGVELLGANKLVADNKNKVLFIGNPESSENLHKSVRNIHGANFLPDFAVNCRSLLAYDKIVICKDSIETIQNKVA